MATTTLWLLAVALAFLLGRIGRGSGRYAYWIGGSDGRVNWSRVTAATGIGTFVATVAVVLAKYVESPSLADEALWAILASELAVLGVNVAQFGVKSWRQARSTTDPADTSRGSAAVNAPDVPDGAPPSPRWMGDTGQ